MPLKLLFTLLLLVLSVLVIGLFLSWNDLAAWVVSQQREFQNAMARSLQSIKAGEASGTWYLCIATAAYGFVHALGPGHGKVLLGGAALASGATLRQMVVLSVAASLAQAISAILLVTVLLQAVKITSRDAVGLAETWLAPISYMAIAAIGALLIARGVKRLHRLLLVKEREIEQCGCGHKHGISVSDVRSLHSWQDAAALVGSIAIRPCTGALFLLVIAARFDIFHVGVLATLTMGLGTALFSIIAASSGVAARQLAQMGTTIAGAGLQVVSAGLHITGGLLVLISALVLFLREIPEVPVVY